MLNTESHAVVVNLLQEIFWSAQAVWKPSRISFSFFLSFTFLKIFIISSTQYSVILHVGPMKNSVGVTRSRCVFIVQPFCPWRRTTKLTLIVRLYGVHAFFLWMESCPQAEYISVFTVFFLNKRSTFCTSELNLKRNDISFQMALALALINVRLDGSVFKQRHQVYWLDTASVFRLVFFPIFVVVYLIVRGCSVQSKGNSFSWWRRTRKNKKGMEISGVAGYKVFISV